VFNNPAIFFGCINIIQGAHLDFSCSLFALAFLYLWLSKYFRLILNRFSQTFSRSFTLRQFYDHLPANSGVQSANQSVNRIYAVASSGTII
jgi:hypothetical protein